MPRKLWSCSQACTDLRRSSAQPVCVNSNVRVRASRVSVDFLLPLPLYHFHRKLGRAHVTTQQEPAAPPHTWIPGGFDAFLKASERRGSCIVHVWKTTSRESLDTILQSSSGSHFWKRLFSPEEGLLFSAQSICLLVVWLVFKQEIFIVIISQWHHLNHMMMNDWLISCSLCL